MSSYPVCGYVAALQVLSVYELLEKILLFTDQRTLLTSCIRVDRAWNSIISSSRRIQRHLYLAPCNEPKDRKGPLNFNPLLDWGFDSWFSDNYIMPEEYRNVVYEHVEDSPQHPFLYWEENWEIDLIDKFRLLQRNLHLEAWRRGEASWRRMQITQPPTRVLNLEHMLCTTDEDPQFIMSKFPLDAHLNRGILMGELYDYIEGQLSQTTKSRITQFCLGITGSPKAYCNLRDTALYLFLVDDGPVTARELEEMEKYYGQAYERKSNTVFQGFSSFEMWTGWRLEDEQKEEEEEEEEDSAGKDKFLDGSKSCRVGR